MPTIELRADLNSEDDEGRWWTLLRDAVDPSQIVPGAVVVAGTERYWATVRIDQVDDDGQVHFVAVEAVPEAPAPGDDFYRSSTGSVGTEGDAGVRGDTTNSRNPSSEVLRGTGGYGEKPRSEPS